MQSNNVFQQKPAFNISVKGGLYILPFRLALTGARTAPPGSAEDVRYVESTFVDGFSFGFHPVTFMYMSSWQRSSADRSTQAFVYT